MRIRHNHRAFMMGFRRRVKLGREKQNDVAEQVVMQSLSSLITESPVDSGRFRGAHDLSMGEPAATSHAAVMSNPPRSPEQCLSDGKKNLQLVANVKGQKVFLSNPLAYGPALENGHSKQAPAGVYGITARRAQLLWQRLAQQFR